MYITIEKYAKALEIAESTASRRLKGLPFVMPKNGRGTHWYPLVAVVQTLRGWDAGREVALVRWSRDMREGDLYIEPAALLLAESFLNWCEGDMKTRARAARNSFVVAVSNSRICTPTIVRNIELLKTLFVLNPEVTRWILVGGTPPNVDRLAPSFAVTNNGANLDVYHTKMEAA